MERKFNSYPKATDCLRGVDNGYHALCKAADGLKKVMVVEQGKAPVECIVKTGCRCDQDEIIFQNGNIVYSVVGVIFLEMFEEMDYNEYCPKFARANVRFHITAPNSKVILASGICSKKKIIGNWIIGKIFFHDDGCKTFTLLQASINETVIRISASFYAESGVATASLQNVIEARKG